jgi:hypothetical protein
VSVSSKLARQHEDDLAEALGGRRSRGSGNQFNAQMDGRTSRHVVPFAWAWDGKCTRGNSISVSMPMWSKAIEQAQGERPMIALRFYEDDRGRNYTDLVTISLDDLREMLQMIDVLQATVRGEM